MTNTISTPEAAPAGEARILRGLVLVFVLSLLSLVGVLLTVTALGGLGEWSRWQFVGMFGMIEFASGMANIILPNIWRLPVAEVQTRARTKVHLTPSVIFIPHWAGVARAAAGFVLVAGAGWSEGVAPATLALPLFVALVAWIVVAASAAVARAGVERPDIDVLQFVIRHTTAETVLPPISIGASVLQFILSIATIPIAKAVPPAAFYRPEIGPSWETLAGTAAVGMATGIVAWLAWRGRIDWRAPRDQQQEAEKFA